MRTFAKIAIATLVFAGTARAQTRVGTFDRQSIVVAYYRSPLWAQTMNAKLAERDAAQKAGDTKKVEELNAWGGAHQDLAHRQLAGEAPVTNIIEALQPAFPEIARTAHVEKILTAPPPAGAKFETVDVTDLIVDWLKSDERTKTIIRDLRTGAHK